MLPLFVQPRRSLAHTLAPLQNLEHEAYTFNLGNDTDVCVIASPRLRKGWFKTFKSEDFLVGVGGG